MGFFSKKKKTSPISPVSSASSSAQSSPLARTPSPPQAPAVVPAPVVPPITLTAVLDGWTEDSRVHTFTIDVDREGDVSTIRRKLVEVLGDVSMSLFKVSIPSLAAKQAKTYTEKYKIPVNLVSSFPAYNLEDEAQHTPSLGPAGWQTHGKSDLSVKDWWPEPQTQDVISLLVRRADGPSTSVPLTFAVHVAQSTFTRATPRGTPGGIDRYRQAPTVIDLDANCCIEQLKATILRADYRKVTSLDKLVLWRVDMSEEEMVVIEDRGGLRAGQMPWPYPPTAPVPTGLADESLPISHYFPHHQSNVRMIQISAYILSTGTEILSRNAPCESDSAPTFRYPMVFDSPSSPASTIRSPPIATPTSPQTPMLGNPAARRVQRGGRPRPSTAPAVVTAVDGPTTPAFGARSTRLRTLAPSPLNTAHPMSIAPKGLGIDTVLLSASPPAIAHRASDASHISTGSAMESEDEGSLPSLDFSLLSFDGISSPGSGSGSDIESRATRSCLVTPSTERSEWLTSPTVISISPPTPKLGDYSANSNASINTTAKPGLVRTLSESKSSQWSKSPISGSGNRGTVKLF